MSEVKWKYLLSMGVCIGVGVIGSQVMNQSTNRQLQEEINRLTLENKKLKFQNGAFTLASVIKIVATILA